MHEKKVVYKRHAVTLGATLLVGLSGCSLPQNDMSAYHSDAWSDYQEITLQPVGQHSSELDLAVRRALIDKGFNVTLVSSTDTTDRAQTLLVFSAGPSAYFGDQMANATLTLLDRRTGQKVKVSSEKVSSRAIHTQSGIVHTTESLLTREFEDPTVSVRRLVDRLFPDRQPWR